MNGLKELIDAINIIVDGKLNRANYDKTYDARISKVNSSTSYDVEISGVVYTLPLYISRNLSVGNQVKVVVPQNNWNKAFIL